MNAAGVAVAAAEFQCAGTVFCQTAFAINVIFPLIESIKSALGSVHIYRYIYVKGAISIPGFVEV